MQLLRDSFGCCFENKTVKWLQYFQLYNMNEYEISKLKKQLVRKNEVIKQMKEDLAFVENQLVTVQAERDKYHGQLQIARHTIENVDQIIDQKVREMKTKLEHENATSFNELQTLRDRLMEEQRLNEKFNEQIRNKDAVISQLSLRLREMSIKHKDNSLTINVKQISEQAAITYNQFYKLTEKYNKLCEDMENILAENKILRKLHGVPDNFGFDLEEIKIAEKQELEDYKAQCRKLQTQIEELEAQRTQLRYRLRQYNTLYSNKGERYKDLTQKQLDLLDAYALNLKDGKDQLPEIDKSQKQMEKQIIRLRAQVEILQSKAPMALMPVGGKPAENSNNQMSKDSVKKLQDQIKSVLQPFVQDIRKLSENNLNSIIQNVQLIQNNTANTSVVSMPVGVSGLRPPIPLPGPNNDWSNIKEGYSYRYACKFPVDLKDFESDVGFDTIRAKYEIAALQLQNMESLKMLKQKQDQEKVIRAELTDLKQKFKKCLLVQDEIFIKFFKTRDEFRQKSKQIELQKRRITDERDQIKTQLSVLKQAFHALSAKTDLENRMKDFGLRLAQSEAGVVKGQRKYKIIFEEHKYLRDAYTKMQLKAAQNEFHLKQKYTKARQNEKILTLLMNQILEETKDSVSSDTHNLLLARMEILNDKSAHFAFKEAELRLKISRLESVERQMNIKDDMIEYLREDKLDLILQLQVIRNRLKSIDPSYRQTAAIFERLVGFINQNSISIMECFKKFDKDKSGNLTKIEFKAALDAFGFKLSNQQFQLLFGQFDLDGSANLNYMQFMRKLKRGGAVSRSQDEKAIYLFFKAIKSSNISIKRAFDIVDKDGSGAISKTQMLTAFKQIGIDIDIKTVDAIFRITDTGMDGTISCPELEQLYYDVVRETQIDQMQFKPELDWKYKFALKLEEAAAKNKMSIQQTFKTLDDDGNSYMTITELSLFLTKLGVQLESKNLDELFRFFDTKYDGKIQYTQFLRILEQSKKEQKRVQRLVAVQKRAQELRKQYEIEKKQIQSSKPTSEALLKIRMQALETKQSNLVRRTENLCKSLAIKEQQIKDHQKSIEQNYKQLNKVQDKYTQQREINITLSQKMKKFIGEIEAKKLREQQKKLTIQNGELATELDTFKNLCNTLADKNKLELMSVEKIKAELNKHYDIVKELQVENINKSQLGRLSMELEYSKRNEEIVNKKYEDVCEETKNLAKLNNEYSNQSLQKEKEIVNTHLLMRQKTNLLQKSIDTLTAKILPTVTITKIEEFMSKLRQISTSKSLLEEQNKSLRQKCFNLQLKYDHIEIQKANLVDLQKKLRRTYTDESSVALIDLTKQLSEYKMAELKAKRQCNMLKQKQEYYMRINNANNDSIKDLEDELGKWQIKYNEREQFWRKRMADQMKLVDDIQKEVQKTKDNDIKAQKYFKEKEIEQQQVEEKYAKIDPEREEKLSKIVRPPSYYRQNSINNQKMEDLKGQIQDLTLQLQDKEREIYRLKTTLQQIVPEQKLRFSHIGSQAGNPTNSFLLQTELTTSQLKNNARRFINTQKQQQTFFKEEAERMAQAAQQSIDTLQRIIDDKNEQIRRKQKIIDDLKREMLKNKEEDCYEIQKLNEEIRELRSKREIASIDQIMNKSTHKQFYPGAANNEEKIKSLMEMIEDKDAEVKTWERKYNELYINKSKVKAPEPANNKIIENKLKEMMEERESERKKYVEVENKMKEKVKNLEKLIKEKDLKLAQLHKSIEDIKANIINQKQEISREYAHDNSELINNMIKGNSANDGRLEEALQKAKNQLALMTKRNREYEAEIKKMREQARLGKTMSRR